MKNGNLSGLSNEELIRMVKRGRNEYFAEIIRKYSPRLYRIAVSCGIFDKDCEEVLQLTFISAFKKIKELKDSSSISTWLARILIDECKLFKKRGEKILDALRKSSVTNPLKDYFKLQNDSLEKEIKKNIERDAQLIPGKFKDVYLLRAKEGMSIKQISKALCISRIEVLIKLYRAKCILKTNKKIVTLNFLLICMASEYTYTILTFFRKIIFAVFIHILQLLNFA